MYEFMALHRPGDVLRYMSVRLVDVHQNIQERVSRDLKERYRFYREADRPAVSLNDFDGLFHLSGDDTAPEDEAWVNSRKRPDWTQRLSGHFRLVFGWQERLRGQDDFLLQHELGLIARREHRQDFLSESAFDAFATAMPPSESVLPPALFVLLRTLIADERIHSVSCHLNDFPLWRLLVAQQVERANKSSQSPQDAFGLCGQECRAPRFIAPLDWGG